MMMTNIFSCFQIFQFFSLQRTLTSFEKGPLETNVAGHIFPMINFNWSRRSFEILSHLNFDTHTIQTNVGRSQFSQNHVLDTCHKSYLSYDIFLGRNFFDDLMRMMRMIRMWKSTLPLRPCSYWPTWPEFSRYRSFPSSLCSTWGDYFKVQLVLKIDAFENLRRFLWRTYIKVTCFLRT